MRNLRICLTQSRLVCLTQALAGLVCSLLAWTGTAWGQPATNPSWASTGSLNTAREYHTATRLPDGRVLVTGGSSWGICEYSTAEIYDPATGTWRSTGSLGRARNLHTATLLPTGQVLVAGGYGCLGNGDGRSAELYDPASDQWRATGNLMTAHAGHTATLLANGQVLIAGGHHHQDGSDARSAELYDPATERWSSTGNTSTVSGFHAAVLLPNNKVLAMGNSDCANIAEVYDPATGRWSATSSPPSTGCADRATLLANGQVLLTGNARAQLYDPVTEEWGTTTPLGWGGLGHTATLLANGQVLLAGGQDGGDFSVNGAELYDPVTGTSGPTTALNRGRGRHSATSLTSGKVLIAGGFDGYCCDLRDTLSSAELFDPGLRQSKTVANVSAASYSAMGLAREGIAAGFGAGLATTTIRTATLPPPTQLAGTTVNIKDSAGVDRLAPLFFVSPTQVSYQVPPGTAEGAANVTITSGDGAVSTGTSLIRTVAPSLFTANSDGEGPAAAFLRRVNADGSSTDEPIAQFDTEQGKYVPLPIDLGPETDRVFLILFGTGIRFRSSLSSVIATVGSAYAEVSFAGAHPDFVGVDQVNVLLPRTLSRRGEVDVLLTVDAQSANPVRINLSTGSNGAPVDLNGGYHAPSSAVGIAGAVASATTHPQGDRRGEGQVYEVSNGVRAVEGTYTPFSDDFNKPQTLSGVDLRGRSFQCDVDLHALNLWNDASGEGAEFLQIGAGRQADWQDTGTEEVFVFIYDYGRGFALYMETDWVYYRPETTYYAPPDETRFQVRVDISANGTEAMLTVIPLNGVRAGTVHSVSPLNLDASHDNVISASFFAGFTQNHDNIASTAKATISNFKVIGKTAGGSAVQ